MDVNPFKKGGAEEAPEAGNEEMPKTSSFQKMKNACKACRPHSGAGWLALVIALVVLWHLGVAFKVLPSTTFPAVDQNVKQAVFLSNGQVYFGNLSEANRKYLMLENIYYLRVSQQLQPPSQEPQTQINLVKLGNELHAPEDTMYIPKGQIVFWENMRPDSPIVQVIEQLEDQENQ